ncbi:Zinc-binding protein A33-like protein [Aphelenchoides besseyi]|nr:Zinc-binding protein A33-like protein [Aphelenchoides besseyi]
MDNDNSTGTATSTVCSSPASATNGSRPMFQKNESGSTVMRVCENQLKCPMCKEFFVKPVSLCCGHTFCKLCCDKWLRSCTTCPVCRIPTLYPVRNVRIEAVLGELHKQRADELSTFQRAIAEPLRRTFRRGKPIREVKALQRESNRASTRRPKSVKFENPKSAIAPGTLNEIKNERNSMWNRSIRKLRKLFLNSIF